MTTLVEAQEVLATDPERRSVGRSHTVIVAEDDNDMRAMLVDWLSSIGCRVIECASGASLVDRLVTTPTPDLSQIDAIVTDERMPGFNGLEALEMLWFIPLPPVLLITAYGDDRVADRARALGGVDVLPKPFDRVAFLAAVTARLA